MRPILLKIGDLVIWSHTVFVVLGISTAVGISWMIARRKNRADLSFLYMLVGGLVGAAIFARLGLVFRYVQVADAPSIAGFIAYGGRTLLGGLAGGYLGVVVTKRLIGYQRNTGDLLAPGVALGIAIGRIGCFLAERPGTPTRLPWGVTVPAEAALRIPGCPSCKAGVAMHPSFLYESLFLAIAAAVLFSFSRRPRRRRQEKWMKEGDSFKIFLLSYGAFRFFVEFVRGNPVMAFGLSGSQLMVLSSLMLFAVYLVRRFGVAPMHPTVAP